MSSGYTDERDDEKLCSVQRVPSTQHVPEGVAGTWVHLKYPYPALSFDPPTKLTTSKLTTTNLTTSKLTTSSDPSVRPSKPNARNKAIDVHPGGRGVLHVDRIHEHDVATLVDGSSSPPALHRSPRFLPSRSSFCPGHRQNPLCLSCLPILGGPSTRGESIAIRRGMGAFDSSHGLRWLVLVLFLLRGDRPSPVPRAFWSSARRIGFQGPRRYNPLVPGSAGAAGRSGASRKAFDQ